MALEAALSGATMGADSMAGFVVVGISVVVVNGREMGASLSVVVVVMVVVVAIVVVRGSSEAGDVGGSVDLVVVVSSAVDIGAVVGVAVVGGGDEGGSVKAMMSSSLKGCEVIVSDVDSVVALRVV